MSVLASALRIRPGEGRPFACLFLLTFSCGAAQACFDVAANSLFLANYDSHIMPWVWLLSALVATPLGWIYVRLERSVSYQHRIRGTLMFLALSVLAFRVLYSTVPPGQLVFAQLLWLDVLVMLTRLAIWGVTLEAMTVRQGKRLFGPVNAGEQLGGMALGFTVAPLASLLGAHNLPFVSGAFLMLGYLALDVFLRTYGDGFEVAGEDTDLGPEQEQAPEPEATRTSLFHMARNPYVARIFLLSCLTIIGFYSLEYLYYNQIESRFSETDRMAGFLGKVFGVAQLCTLIGAWFVSNRLLERFGVRVALVLLPMGLSVAGAVALGVGWGAGLGVGFFWVLVATKVMDIVLRGTVADEAMLVLYQPLEPGQRGTAQSRAEGVVEPISTGLGAVLLIGVLGVSQDPRVLLAFLILPMVAWAGLSWETGRAYAGALVSAIDRRLLSGGSIRLIDASTINVFQERLGSTHPGEVIYCLDNLERLGHPRLDQLMFGLLAHPSAVVRRETLARLERRRPPEAALVLQRRMQLEPDPDVRAMALRAMAALGTLESTALVLPRLTDVSLDVRHAVVLGLMHSGDVGAQLVAAGQLARMVDSRRSDERRAAAEILGDLGASSAWSLLRPLLIDPDPAVSRAALVAAGRLRNAALLPELVERMTHTGLRASAAEALVALGPVVLPRLDAALREPGQARPVRARIAHVLGRIGTREAAALLRDHLGDRDVQVRGHVLAALSLCKYRAPTDENIRFHAAVREEVEGVTRLLASLRTFPDEPSYMYLRGALREELDGARRRIFYLLSFLYDSKTILTALESLDHSSMQRRDWAVEAVDVQLGGELKPLVLPLLEHHTDEERLMRLELRFPQPRLDRVARLRELIVRDDGLTSLWTRLCAVRTSVVLEARTLWEVLEPLVASREAVLRETGAWALAMLDPRRAQEPLRALRADPSEAVSSLAIHMLNNPTREAPMLLTVEKVIILKSVSIFSRTPEEVLVDVASVLREVQVRAGNTIFEKGDIGTSMYFIVSGLLRIHDGDVTVAELGEREIVGELAVLDPQPRSASVTARKDTLLLQLDRDALYELMTDRVEVARGIIQVLCHKLRVASGSAVPGPRVEGR